MFFCITFQTRLKMVDHLIQEKEFLSPDDTLQLKRINDEINYLSRFSTDQILDSDAEIDRIRKLVFSNATPVINPSVNFLGGGTASGKTTVKIILISLGIISQNHVNIDSDMIMLELDDWNKTSMATNCAASKLHEKAGSIANIFYHEAINQSLNIIYDGTMSSKNNAMEKIMIAKNSKYLTVMAGISTSTSVSCERALTRAATSHRYVPLSAIVASHIGYSANYFAYVPWMNLSLLYDNNGANPILILNGSLILNVSDFALFMNKQAETLASISMLLPKDILEKYKSLERECGLCNNVQNYLCEAVKGYDWEVFSFVMIGICIILIFMLVVVLINCRKLQKSQYLNL